MPSKAEIRQKWNDAGKDVVVLHMYERARTRPNASPFVLKFETFLKVAGIEYIVDHTQPQSSKGKSPWMTFNGKDMADSQFCIEHLCKELGGDKDTEKDLTEEQKARSLAIRIMFEDHFVWCNACITMVHNQGKYMRSVLGPFPVPGFLQNLVWKQFTKQFVTQAKAQGIGRHTKDEVEALALADLKATSTFLGNKPFFLGDKPSVVDCVVFAFLATLFAGDPEDTNVLKKKLEEEDGDMKNLKAHFERIKEKYWDDWDEKLYKEDEKTKKKEEKKEEGDEKKEEDGDKDKDKKDEDKKD